MHSIKEARLKLPRTNDLRSGLTSSCFRLLGIGFRSELSLHNERMGRIITRHVHLDHADAVGNVESLIVEKILELFLSLDHIALRLLFGLLAAEERQHKLVVVGLDVVVGCLLAMD